MTDTRPAPTAKDIRDWQLVETTQYVLGLASGILLKKDAWCRGAPAKNRDGRTVSPLSSDACQWDTWGAIRKAAQDVCGDDLNRGLDLALRCHHFAEGMLHMQGVIERVCNLAWFNDHVAQGPHEMIHVLNQTAKSLPREAYGLDETTTRKVAGDA